MNDAEDDPRGIGPWLRHHRSTMIGIAGLIAWLVRLWLMFGDVL